MPENFHADYKIHAKKIHYAGFFHLAEYQLSHRLFNGQWSRVFIRELLEHPGAVSVLPYDPVTEHVVLVEQFRTGVMNTEVSPWLLELVAGMIDTNESHIEVAQRETQEEIGTTLLDLMPINNFWLSPGAMSERVWLFCGKVNRHQVASFCGLVEDVEDIKVHVITINEAFHMLETGKICNATAIIALQWLQLHKKEVDSKWK